MLSNVKLLTIVSVPDLVVRILAYEPVAVGVQFSLANNLKLPLNCPVPLALLVDCPAMANPPKLSPNFTAFLRPLIPLLRLELKINKFVLDNVVLSGPAVVVTPVAPVGCAMLITYTPVLPVLPLV